MPESLTSEKRLAMECSALGCQHGNAHKLIQELRAEKADLIKALTHAKQWLEGWASAEPEIAYIEKAIQKATQPMSEPVLRQGTAQHEETGRIWQGPREQIPPGFAEVQACTCGRQVEKTWQHERTCPQYEAWVDDR